MCNKIIRVELIQFYEIRSGSSYMSHIDYDVTSSPMRIDISKCYMMSELISDRYNRNYPVHFVVYFLDGNSYMVAEKYYQECLDAFEGNDNKLKRSKRV